MNSVGITSIILRGSTITFSSIVIYIIMKTIGLPFRLRVNYLGVLRINSVKSILN